MSLRIVAALNLFGLYNGLKMLSSFQVVFLYLFIRPWRQNKKSKTFASKKKKAQAKGQERRNAEDPPLPGLMEKMF